MFNAKWSILVLIIIAAVTNCFAQQKIETSTLQFHSINNVGLLQSQAGSAFQLQTINGVQLKSWFAGIGIGLDDYRFRTIPFFIDLRKEISKTKNKFFIYTDVGTNYQDEISTQKTTFNLYPNYNRFNKGLYYDAGVGYKLKFKKNAALLFSAGYTYKKISENSTIYYGQPDVYYFTNPVFIEHYNYGLNKLTLKVSWEF